jgi:negative regulator of flagellin synthesis FlgM
MRIDGISSIDPIQPDKKTGRAGKLNETPNTDTISISSEAIEKAELYRARELVAAAPDVRMDRVEELRARINDPAYINDKVIDATAEKLIDAFFG